MADSTNNTLRAIPAMDALLDSSWASRFFDCLGRETVKNIIREALDRLKRDICAGAQLNLPIEKETAIRAEELLMTRMSSTLKPVVNATGIVIHTNLGRAPLSDSAINAAAAISGVYSTLEYSPESGGRGGRNAHVEWLIRLLTGAEAALVVNNNAAAVLLALSATAAGREVIVSAGELVEIGGSFRIPEILEFSGAKMITVGCTNSTRISDYSGAITENTAVLLKVHPSNYKIEGFVKSASREELCGLASSRRLVFMEDLGSGLLVKLDLPFTNHENSVKECLKDGGADGGIVTFSGDKLLGGPQIGVIAGSKQLIKKMKEHQLARALRVDKITLAAFEATLRLYFTGRYKDIPVIKMITLDKKDLHEKALVLCRILKDAAARNNTGDLDISIVETSDAVGGGAYPTDALPGFGVALRSASISAEALAAKLRTAQTPVVPGIRDGSVVLHVRTLITGDELLIASALTACN